MSGAKVRALWLLLALCIASSSATTGRTRLRQTDSVPNNVDPASLPPSDNQGPDAASPQTNVESFEDGASANNGTESAPLPSVVWDPAPVAPEKPGSTREAEERIREIGVEYIKTRDSSLGAIELPRVCIDKYDVGKIGAVAERGAELLEMWRNSGAEAGDEGLTAEQFADFYSNAIQDLPLDSNSGALKADEAHQRKNRALASITHSAHRTKVSWLEFWVFQCNDGMALPGTEDAEEKDALWHHRTMPNVREPAMVFEKKSASEKKSNKNEQQQQKNEEKKTKSDKKTKETTQKEQQQQQDQKPPKGE